MYEVGIHTSFLSRKGQLLVISFGARESSFNNSRVLQLVVLEEGLSVHQARQVHRPEVRHRREHHRLQAWS